MSQNKGKHRLKRPIRCVDDMTEAELSHARICHCDHQHFAHTKDGVCLFKGCTCQAFQYQYLDTEGIRKDV